MIHADVYPDAIQEASTSFEFDAFELDEASNGQSLSMLAFFLIKVSRPKLQRGLDC